MIRGNQLLKLLIQFKYKITVDILLTIKKLISLPSKDILIFPLMRSYIEYNMIDIDADKDFRHANTQYSPSKKKL